MKKLIHAISLLALFISASEACTALRGSFSNILCFADSLKSTLNSSQVSQLQLTYTYKNAQTWSNLPTNQQTRLGLSLGSFNSNQLSIVKSLLREISGSTPKEGYEEIMQHIAADDYLKSVVGGSNYGGGLYFLCFNGTPSLKGIFSIKLSGHHFSLENTYQNGILVGATPHFIGIEPTQFTYDNTAFQPLIEEKNALASLLSSLNSTELNTAKLNGSYGDVTLGAANGGTSKDWSFPQTKQGLRIGNLNPSQKNLVLNALKTYVFDMSDFEAERVFNLYTSELEDTYLGYAGNISLNNVGGYVRLDGPSVWIEFIVQSAVNVSGVHYHSIWRDHNRDYGGQGSTAGIQSTAFGKSDVTSVFQQNSGISIDLISHPSSQTIHLALTGKNLQVSKIYLSDVKGKIIRNFFNQQKPGGQQNFTFSLVNIPRGIYFLNLKIGAQKRILKVVKK